MRECFITYIRKCNFSFDARLLYDTRGYVGRIKTSLKSSLSHFSFSLRNATQIKYAIFIHICTHLDAEIIRQKSLLILRNEEKKRVRFTYCNRYGRWDLHETNVNTVTIFSYVNVLSYETEVLNARAFRSTRYAKTGWVGDIVVAREIRKGWSPHESPALKGSLS